MTITHQSTDDLRDKLRGKLEKLVEPADDIAEGDYEDVVLDGEVLDLKKELGLDDVEAAADEVAQDENYDD